MSEQNDDPTLETEDTAVSTPQENWEQRYKDAQAWGTRQAQERAQYETAAQELERLRSDPDAQKEFLATLGYQVEDEPDPSEPLPYLTREEWQKYQDDQAAQQAQQAEKEQLARAESFMSAETQRLAVPDHVKRLVVSDALVNLPPNSQGLPDIETAYKHYLDEVRVAEQQAWQQTKKAPRVSASGQPGTDTPDLLTMSEADRQKWMISQLEDE